MNELWDRLGRIRTSRLRVEDGGTMREGSGTVTVDRPDPFCIAWDERGTWSDAPGHMMAYRDRLRWTWDSARGILVLHHARRGDDSAVHLGDLAQGPDGTWRSLAPHLCGRDQYVVEVVVRREEMIVEWTVAGPKKGYTLRRRYH